MRIDSRSGRRYHIVLHERFVYRPVPRSAYPQHWLYQGVEAHVGCRRILARQREEQDADAYIRYFVPQEVDARRVSGDVGGGQEARPPQAGQRAGTLYILSESGSGSAVVAAQGRRAARNASCARYRRSTATSRSSRPISATSSFTRRRATMPSTARIRSSRYIRRSRARSICSNR